MVGAPASWILALQPVTAPLLHLDALRNVASAASSSIKTFTAFRCWLPSDSNVTRKSERCYKYEFETQVTDACSYCLHLTSNPGLDFLLLDTIGAAFFCSSLRGSHPHSSEDRLAEQPCDRPFPSMGYVCALLCRCWSSRTTLATTINGSLFTFLLPCCAALSASSL